MEIRTRTEIKTFTSLVYQRTKLSDMAGVLYILDPDRESRRERMRIGHAHAYGQGHGEDTRSCFICFEFILILGCSF